MPLETTCHGNQPWSNFAVTFLLLRMLDHDPTASSTSNTQDDLQNAHQLIHADRKQNCALLFDTHHNEHTWSDGYIVFRKKINSPEWKKKKKTECGSNGTQSLALRTVQNYDRKITNRDVFRM